MRENGKRLWLYAFEYWVKKQKKQRVFLIFVDSEIFFVKLLNRRVNVVNS